MSYEYPALTVKEPVLLDFGAIGKSYAIDIVGKLLEEKGISDYTINAGGDILHRGGTPIRVGLEHPNDPKQIIGIAEISNKSICGSAGNRRAWGEYHHIINPDTVTSPKHISAVWVIVERNKDTKNNKISASTGTALADALTTGLFFIEPTILSQRLKLGFEYLIVYADNTIKKSTGFTAEVF